MFLFIVTKQQSQLSGLKFLSDIWNQGRHKTGAKMGGHLLRTYDRSPG